MDDIKTVNQEEALQFFSLGLQTLKNSEKCFESVDDLRTMSTNLQEIANEKSLKLQDLYKQHEELMKSLNALDKEHKEMNEVLQKETMLISQLQSTVSEKTEEARVLLDYKQQYSRRLIKASSNVSAKDLQLLDTLKKKLEAYKKLTGVIWDYPSCTEDTLSGYVRDNADRRLKMFHLDIAGKARDQIVQEIWKIVEKKSANPQN